MGHSFLVKILRMSHCLNKEGHNAQKVHGLVIKEGQLMLDLFWRNMATRARPCGHENPNENEKNDV